ncbi:MAG: type IV secretory system conjugative DNA transfer family protein [Trueperaceae bacterium]
MKTLIAALSFSLFALGLVGNANALRHSFERAALSLPGYGLQGFVTCTLQPGCFNSYTAALNGYFPKLPTILMVTSLLPLALIFKRKKKLTYSASFAARDDLKDVTLTNWLRHQKLARSLLVGHYVDLPEPGPKRRQVLSGTFRADKPLLAISPGYGKRPELGHMALFGMARAGKSLHLIAQLCTWGGSVVTLDIKGELFRLTGGLRAKKGRIFVLSPTGKGHRFDALSAVIASHNGYATAAQIIATPQIDKDPVFAQRATLGIKAALRAAVLSGEPPLLFIRKLLKLGGVTAFVQNINTVLAQFNYTKPFEQMTDDERNADEAQTNLQMFLGLDAGQDFSPELVQQDRFLQSTWGNLSLRLKPFVQDGVRHILSGSDFEAKELMMSPCTVYLDFPEESLEATSPVYNLLVTGLMRAMTKYVDEERSGQRPPVPVILALDEIARAPLQDLSNLLATVTSRNISVLLYLQSPSQFDAIYAKDVTDAILNNCATQIYFKSESLSTAKYISERCHKISVSTESQSKRHGFWFRPTHTTSSTPREVITIDEIMMLGGAERQLCIAMISGKPPTLVKRVNYYEVPALKIALRTPAPDLTVLDTHPQPPTTTEEKKPVMQTKPAEPPSPPPAPPIYLQPPQPTKPELKNRFTFKKRNPN